MGLTAAGFPNPTLRNLNHCFRNRNRKTAYTQAEMEAFQRSKREREMKSQRPIAPEYPTPNMSRYG